MTYLFALFAVWRISHMLAQESGPWELVWKIRRKAGESQFGIMMDCVACSSFWVAIPTAYLAGQTWSERGLLWLALSGGATLLERIYIALLPRS